MTIILTPLSLKVSSFYFRKEKLKYKLKGLYPQLIFGVATDGRKGSQDCMGDCHLLVPEECLCSHITMLMQKAQSALYSIMQMPSV